MRCKEKSELGSHGRHCHLTPPGLCIKGTNSSEDYGSCTRGCGDHVEAEELAVLAYVTIEVVAPRQRQTPWTNVAIHWAALASAAFAEPKALEGIQ